MMKSLLLCLALLLVPTSLMACPGGGPCGCHGEEAFVNVEEAVTDVLGLMASIAGSNVEAANKLGPAAQQLMMEVQFSVEDEAVAAAIAGEFQKGYLLFQVAMEDLNEASKLSALATLEDGPDAASLNLQAASKFASATGKLLRSCKQLQLTITLAEEALELVEEDDGPTATDKVT